MNNFIRFSTLLLISFVTAQAFTLKDGFKLALENDMDSKVNKNNIKNIQYDKEIADALLYPSLDFTATAETTNLTQGQLTPGDNGHTKKDEYKLSFTQPIFDGFESKFEKQLQKERYKSAIYYLKESENQIALDYTESYINTLKEKDLLSLNKENLTISEEIFNKVHKKVSKGYGTKLEFENAKGNFLESKVNLNIQKINFKEAIENLKFLVQSDFDSNELIKPKFNYELPKNLKEAVYLSLKNNPSINVTKSNLKVTSFEEKKSTKDFYPNVNFVGSYKTNNALYSEDDSKYNEYKVGFSLNYNLYNGGKDRLNNKKVLQDIKEKKYLIKKSEYKLKNSVRLSWNSYKLNKEKEESLKQYLLVKKDILDATIKEFDLGLKDLNSMLDVHVDYIDVKKDLISNSYDLLISKYKLLNSLGTLPNLLQDNIPSLEKVNTDAVVNDLIIETKYSFNDINTFGEDVKLLHSSTQIKSDYLKDAPKQEVKNLNNQPISSSDSTFKDRFLSASKNKYTINLAYSNSIVKAQRLLDRFDISDNSFFFSFRKVNPLQKIMYGIYDTKEEAKEALNSLPMELKKNRPLVERVVKKQKLYKKYHGKYDSFVKTDNFNVDISKPTYSNKTLIYKTVAVSNSIIDISKNDYSFKDKFLSAEKNKYTINLAYSNSIVRAQGLLDRFNISDNSFFFSFRNKNPLQKIMYGIYDTKSEAKKALNSLPIGLKKNRPIIERIVIKQKLYEKYHGKYKFITKDNFTKTKDSIENFELSKTIDKTNSFIKKRASFVNTSFSKSDILDNKENFTFKDKFLRASKNKYTINLAYSDSKEKAQRLLDKHNLSEDSFYFSFRKVKPLQRIVHGVFNTKKEAFSALRRLPKELKRNKPLVEKITIKQKVYYKYHSYTFISNQLGRI